MTYFSADKFWDRAADDLFAYAEHAKRKFTLTEADVDLLMKRYPRISGLFFVLPTKFVSAVINFLVIFPIFSSIRACILPTKG